MPYSVSWLLDGHVIYDYLMGDVSLDDVAETSDLISEKLKQGQAVLVHLIVDVQDINKLPMGLNVKKISQSVSHMKEANLGWTILITTNPITRFLASIATQITRTRFRSVASREDAMKFLKTVDSTLPETLTITEATIEAARSEAVQEIKV